MNLNVRVYYHLLVTQRSGHNSNLRMYNCWRFLCGMYFNMRLYYHWCFLLGGNYNMWSEYWVVLNWSDRDTWVDFRCWHM